MRRSSCWTLGKAGRSFRTPLRRLAADGARDIVVLGVGHQADAWEAPPPLATCRLTSVGNDHLLVAAYVAADACVVPSLTEQFGLVALESMACGTPVVAFATGGIPEVVRHHETGYLVPPGDAEALAEGLRTVLSDTGLRERLGRRAREVVLAEYTVELQARRHARLYEEVARARHRGVAVAAW